MSKIVEEYLIVIQYEYEIPACRANRVQRLIRSTYLLTHSYRSSTVSSLMIEVKTYSSYCYILHISYVISLKILGQVTKRKTPPKSFEYRFLLFKCV